MCHRYQKFFLEHVEMFDARFEASGTLPVQGHLVSLTVRQQIGQVCEYQRRLIMCGNAHTTRRNSDGAEEHVFHK